MNIKLRIALDIIFYFLLATILYDEFYIEQDVLGFCLWTLFGLLGLVIDVLYYKRHFTKC